MTLPVLTPPGDVRLDARFLRELPGDPELRVFSRQVPGACWSRVAPTPVADPKLLAWSSDLAADLGLPTTPPDPDALAAVFGGNALWPGMDPYAARYGGHQFGHWAGQLGDGRAITLGELVRPTGERFELQLKGAGRTPYSRGADGRAVLRSSLREFVCSEAMHHLGVPTTRALSLVRTGDAVVRDMFYDGNPAEEPGAVVCRVAPTFLRLGNFEILGRTRDERTLVRLLDHTLAAWFPHLGPTSPSSVVAMLEQVCRATAVMVAHWMRVGFVHGVMNTDNLSILGLTVDYGPYGWLEPYEPGWTPNTTDLPGRRYAFGNQPRVAGWNLARFAEALLPVVNDVPALERALASYARTFDETHGAFMADKLGFERFCPGVDRALFTDLDETLQAAPVDMTLFYRHLADVPVGDVPDEALLAPLEPAFYQPLRGEAWERWRQWLRRWGERVRDGGLSDAARVRKMNKTNPLYVPRNYLASTVIEQVERGDVGALTSWMEALRAPYDVRPGLERYAGRRPEWARNRAGCSMLSCSS
jgi:uncharacterized protein YdiU (UPF0061 family)